MALDPFKNLDPEFRSLFDSMLKQYSSLKTGFSDDIAVWANLISTFDVNEARKTTLTGFMLGVYVSFTVLFPGGKEEIKKKLAALKLAPMGLKIVKGDKDEPRH